MTNSDEPEPKPEPEPEPDPSGSSGPPAVYDVVCVLVAAMPTSALARAAWVCVWVDVMSAMAQALQLHRL